MASHTPLMMPFLRPLSLPRPNTLRHFLRFSTTTRCKAQAAPRRAPKAPQSREDRNLAASRTASPTYPPPSMLSLPRPKESKASRRTAHPPKKRPYPTRQPSHTAPAPQKLIPDPVIPLPAAQCAPNLPYFVTRTRSNELPVYQLNKRGGNLKLTRVRKIDGDPEVLRDELRVELERVVGAENRGPKGKGLGWKREDCVVNPVTRQVVIKGHFRPVVERFLRERLF